VPRPSLRTSHQDDKTMNLKRSILPVGLISLFVACSQQGEGERCTFNSSGDSDCASGLVCVKATALELESTAKYQADRCCPPGKNAWTDPNCEPKAATEVTTSTGGTAGAVGGGTQTGSAGTSSAGAANDSTAGAASTMAGSAGTGT